MEARHEIMKLFAHAEARVAQYLASAGPSTSTSTALAPAASPRASPSSTPRPFFKYRRMLRRKCRGRVVWTQTLLLACAPVVILVGLGLVAYQWVDDGSDPTHR